MEEMFGRMFSEDGERGHHESRNSGSLQEAGKGKDSSLEPPEGTKLTTSFEPIETHFRKTVR